MDGELLPASEARVSVFDHGLLTGDGVFETMNVCRGRPFALTRHLDRLARSAAGLGLPVPDGAMLRGAVAAVIDADGLDEGRVRVTVTGGPGPLGSDRGAHAPTVIVAAATPPPWPPTVEVVVAPWPKNEKGALAGLKTTSYAENVLALGWARQQGAGEAVFANLAGVLCEGTGTNVFVAAAGRLVTPPLSSGCLAGVTRGLLLELGVAEEHDVGPADLRRAPEACLTSSTREVHPIRAVDGVPLPDAPGPLTRAATAAFEDLKSRDLDP